MLAYNYLLVKYGLTFTKIEDVRIKGHLSESLVKGGEVYYPVGFGVAGAGEKVFGAVMEYLLS